MDRSFNWVFGICITAVCLGVPIAFGIAVRPDPARAAAERASEAARAAAERAYCDRISPIEVRVAREVHGHFNGVDCGIVGWDVRGRTADGQSVRLRVEPNPPLDPTCAARIWVRPRAGRFALADAR